MEHDPVRKEHLKLREADRVQVELNAFLTFESNLEIPIVVTDLSTCGFSCQSPERLAIGNRVMLHMPNLGQFLATVVWQLGDNAGVRFVPPLAVTKVMSIIIAAVEEQRSVQEQGETGDAA